MSTDISSLFGNNAGTPIDMMQANPQSVLSNQFFQTPGYQLNQGQYTSTDPLQAFAMSPMYQLMYGANYNTDPSQRFANDPGTQMAVQQGQNQLAMQDAAHGLSGSGAAAKDMGNYMYGQYGNFIQNQGNALNNYQNTNNTLFSNYQNQLANLMGVGVSQSGATNAMTAGQNQANTIAGANLSTGNNISSLFANQGVYNANATLGTGAANSNNLFNGMGFLAQLNQNAIAGQNGQQASLFNGLGQASGMSGGTF